MDENTNNMPNSPDLKIPDTFGNLVIGDISALDWIDSNGGSDDEEEIISHRPSSRTQQYAEHKTQNLYETRECGDGDSGEEICGSLDRIDEIDEEDDIDPETYSKKGNSTFTIG